MTYFDSSVLFSALVVGDEDHAASAFEVNAAGDKITSAHALAETFATLTGGKIRVKVSPRQALEMIEQSILPHLRVHAISPDDYLAAMEAAENVGARGGAIYDLLHIEIARLHKVKRILTLNYDHFVQFAPDLAARVQRPSFRA